MFIFREMSMERLFVMPPILHRKMALDLTYLIAVNATVVTTLFADVRFIQLLAKNI